jgi:hypothetical protein
LITDLETTDRPNRKIIGPAFISLIARKILEREDSFDDIPEEVLNDLIRRLEE